MSTTLHQGEIAPAPAPLASPERNSHFWQWLRNALPTALVLASLAGLAWLGHSTDWTLPKFSELVFGSDVTVDNWCKDHSVPASQCIVCNKGLIPVPVNHGWCKEHGVAQCPFEHPDIVQLTKPSVVTEEDRQRAARALDLRVRSENNIRCLQHERPIQFASLKAIEKLGIDVAVVSRRPTIEAIVANGEVNYAETHAARLASRVAGTMWRVEKQVGDPVKKGDVLALIDAAEVGREKAALLQAIAQERLRQKVVDRYKPLAADGAVPGRVFQEAQAELQEAQIRLLESQQALVNLGLAVNAGDYADLTTEEVAKRIRYLGLPESLVASFDDGPTTSNLYPLRAPLNGIVTTRNVVSGEVVDTSSVLFSLADTRLMWLTLNVRQDDARYLSLGQRVLFEASGGGDLSDIQGTLAWISTEADEDTRTIKVRANLPNIRGELRANTFGTGRIVLRDEPQAVVVPTEAVHWDGCCNVVFVRDKDFFKENSPKFFHVRKVRLGVKDGEFTEVIAGLLPGEVIASKNSVVLEAELMKSNLGAGCCEVHMPKK